MSLVFRGSFTTGVRWRGHRIGDMIKPVFENPGLCAQNDENDETVRGIHHVSTDIGLDAIGH